ncbi:MAG: hypothetical protein HY744_04895 [Deltaproteobacteria bacterium]|nr:hypothetical protein [Deltaproteobacteria bacterium]
MRVAVGWIAYGPFSLVPRARASGKPFLGDRFRVLLGYGTGIGCSISPAPVGDGHASPGLDAAELALPPAPLAIPPELPQ